MPRVRIVRRIGGRRPRRHVAEVRLVQGEVAQSAPGLGGGEEFLPCCPAADLTVELLLDLVRAGHRSNLEHAVQGEVDDGDLEAYGFDDPVDHGLQGRFEIAGCVRVQELDRAMQDAISVESLTQLLRFVHLSSPNRRYVDSVWRE